MEPGLYIIGTPIGNLGDVSARALDALRGLDVLFAEDTRVTARLLARFAIRVPTVSCHRFNEAARTERVLDAVRSGKRAGLVTDSGMPGVSDPGARIVAACREAGLPVHLVPGPSAVTAAVALCGFAGAGFLFAGFLPHKSGPRRRRLEELRGCADPVVLYESPFRLKKLLAELNAVMPLRRVFVGRELTKKFEEHLAGTAADVAAQLGDRTVKGELVVVVDRAGRGAAAADAPPDAGPPA